MASSGAPSFARFVPEHLLAMTPVRSILALLLCAVPLSFVGCDAADPIASSVTVAGVVLNTFGQPLGDATVLINSADGTDGTTATTAQDGTYTASVPPGVYSLGVTARGYVAGAQTMTIGEAGTTTANYTMNGPAKLVGQVVNAATGQGQANVTLQCVRQNLDGSFPDPLARYDFSVQSDPEGNLTVFGAPYGPMRCHASGPGFDARVFEVSLLRDGETGIPPVVIVPPPPDGALRVVLTWGQDPNDLDSHLSGPDGNGGRYHVYYANRSYGQTNLDVDDVSSFGPETITIFPTGEGAYRYSVFNFSNQSTTGAQGIAFSPSRVEVHDVDGLVCSYVPSTTVTSANTWRVFEATAQDVGGTLKMVAPCARGQEGLAGIGYVMAGDSGDIGTFLVLPPKAQDG